MQAVSSTSSSLVLNSAVQESISGAAQVVAASLQPHLAGALVAAEVSAAAASVQEPLPLILVILIPAARQPVMWQCMSSRASGVPPARGYMQTSTASSLPYGQQHRLADTIFTAGLCSIACSSADPTAQAASSSLETRRAGGQYSLSHSRTPCICLQLAHARQSARAA